MKEYVIRLRQNDYLLRDREELTPCVEYHKLGDVGGNLPILVFRDTSGITRAFFIGVTCFHPTTMEATTRPPNRV